MGPVGNLGPKWFWVLIFAMACVGILTVAHALIDAFFWLIDHLINLIQP